MKFGPAGPMSACGSVLRLVVQYGHLLFPETRQGSRLAQMRLVLAIEVQAKVVSTELGLANFTAAENISS